jgi:hypothetical protein
MNSIGRCHSTRHIGVVPLTHGPGHRRCGRQQDGQDRIPRGPKRVVGQDRVERNVAHRGTESQRHVVYADAIDLKTPPLERAVPVLDINPTLAVGRELQRARPMLTHQLDDAIAKL